MSFDIIAYSQALDEFLMRMEKVPSHKHKDIPAALDPLCKLLRVAAVKVRLVEPPQKPSAKPYCEEAEIYRAAESDESRSLCFNETTGDGGRATYTFEQYVGGEDWTEEEKSRIAVISKMLFVFHGRIRVMHIAEHLTYHDSGLGFYNLNFFMRTVGELIHAGKIGSYTACYFNLKSFSYVNRLLGRDNATVVMVEYIKRLEALFGEGGGLVARIGGDNWAAIFRKEKLDAVREHLRGTGIVYDEERGEKVRISSTAGFYIIPEEGVNAPTDIMDNISVALNIARMTKESSAFYNEDMAHSIRETKEIEDIFPDAVKNEEFEVYYQPKVSLKSYRLAGAEALCRWFHNGEMVMPYKFIPVLEQTRAITVLDFYMLEQVCRDIRQWLDEGRPVVKVSVNFSRRHLGDMNLLQHILDIVDRYSVPHKYIEIELTETTTDVDFRDLREIVTGLQAEGISTSVDDFGMGYSSLNLIRGLPWNVLKIDKSFLDEDQKNNSAVMLKHVISMAQEIGLECIVEGVETAEQVKRLKDNNCFLAQGFYFDRPLPKKVYEERLDGLRKENRKTAVAQ